MWKFNPFTLTPREPTSLEGRTVDIGNIKVYVRNAIAEGGFSCVYLARDAVNTSKHYALKHIICNDGESLEHVVKEVSVMKMLRGHPNVVSLVAHAIFDMGRTKEALLVMECCEKSLVTVLEKRGATYFEEKHILSIFRDVCNAVFSMHCQSPPIAHRDLKAENVLLGSDGVWKLCDFGSTSTKHKCFDRPEERGIEEDNIRKHTTPAYRAPEMWDLYRNEVISEKVDIWALGCLLYRICYLKSAFDGESKLQILNGNYRIPEVPKYTSSIITLIKDMLEASPDARPDITQVWFRVNEQLPVELQKHLPDGPAGAVNIRLQIAKLHAEGVAEKTNLTPQRNPPPTSLKEHAQNISPQSQGTQKAGGKGGGRMGSFWISQHAEEKDASNLRNIESTQKDSPERLDSNPSRAQHRVNKATSQNQSATFVADFDTRLSVGNASTSRSGKEQEVLSLNILTLMAPLHYCLVFLLLSCLLSLSSASHPHALLLPVKKDPSTLQYVTSISQRTPLNLVVDLGSRFLWLDCDSPSTSSRTRHPVLCHAPQCSLIQTPFGCSDNTSTCSVLLDNPYSFGTTGTLATDATAFRSTNGYNAGPIVRAADFIFTCASTSLLKGLARGASGMAGFGRNRIGLPVQVAVAFRLRPVFALCLGSSGVIFIGEGPYHFLLNVEASQGLIYTPLLVNRVSTAGAYVKGERSVEYFIGVTAIKINNKVVPVNTTLLSIDKHGNGGTKISTVTPYMTLETSIYKAVTRAFAASLSGVKRAAPVGKFSVCYNYKDLGSTRVGVAVPQIDLVLQSESVYWRVLGANSMVETKAGVYCLAFVDGGVSPNTAIVIGGHQIEDNLLQFDLKRGRLGFTSSLLFRQTTCANFNFTAKP